jgi:hypothetical protein
MELGHEMDKIKSESMQSIRYLINVFEQFDITSKLDSMENRLLDKHR